MKPIRSTQVALVLMCSLLTSCATFGPAPQRLPSERPSRAGIAVASFDFPESELLAQLFATALEERGYPVTRSLNLGSRETVQPALLQGWIDLVPEYLGTALSFATLGRADATSAAEKRRRLATALGPEGIDVLPFAAAQNQNGIVVTTDTAAALGLTRISDLRDVAGRMTFGGPPECPERPLCLPGLEDRYGLRFDRFVPLDASGPTTVAALEVGEVDVALLFTTDPDIDAHDFVLLEDDLNLQPPENVTPVVRREVFERYGDGVAATLRAVTERLTTRALRALNREVEIGDRNPADVAREWLVERGVV